ncbi:hypothetical protein ONZ45_g18895 [Pleurotus djamor]|nr:hypothetical protein ONZ45_g18895 [Pleurotus djamor]
MPVPASTFAHALPAPTQANSASASATAMSDALRLAQLEIDTLKTQIETLEDENAELQAQVAELKATKKTQKRRGAASESPEDLLTQASKRFIVENALWMPPGSFQAKPPLPSDHPTYFVHANPTTIELGYAAELYEVTPNEVHHMLSVSSTARLFFSGLNGKRPNLLNKIKNAAAKIFQIIGITEDDLKDKESTKILSLIKRNVNADDYPITPPILSPLEGQQAQSNRASDAIFMNPVLPRIYRVALFTSSALDGGHPATNSDGHRWAVNTVTPGGIAMTAVMLRHTPYWKPLVEWYHEHVFYDITSTANPSTSSQQNTTTSAYEDFSSVIRNAIDSVRPPSPSTLHNNDDQGPATPTTPLEMLLLDPLANMQLDPTQDSQVLIPRLPENEDDDDEAGLPSNSNAAHDGPADSTEDSTLVVAESPTPSPNTTEAGGSAVRGRGRARGRGRGSRRVVSDSGGSETVGRTTRSRK